MSRFSFNTPLRAVRFGFLYNLLILLFLLPFIYAAFFIFPGGDDFARAVDAEYLFDIPGGLHEMFRAWWKWSGRYTHHFIVVFLGDIVMSRSGYTLLCLGNMAWFVLSVAGISAALSRTRRCSTHVFFGLLLLLAFMSSYKGLSGTMYLATDIFALGFAVNLCLSQIWALCALWHVRTISPKLRFACYGLSIAAAGTYEYAAVMVAMVSVTAYLLARLYSHPHTRLFKHICITAIVCLLLSFFARGNFRRQDKRTESAIMLTQLAEAWDAWAGTILPALATPLWAAVAAWVCWLFPQQQVPVTKKVPLWMVVLYCFLAAAAFHTALTIVHAMSDVPVHGAAKIQGALSFFTVIIMGACLIACRQALRLEQLCRIPKLLAVAGLLALFALGENWQLTLWGAGSGAYAQFAVLQEQRLSVYLSNQGKDLVVSPLVLAPFPIYQGDPVLPSPKEWPTKYVSRLYGLNSVCAVPADACRALADGRSMDRLALQPLQGLPGSRAAYVPYASGGPNPTYELAWLFLQIPEDIAAAHENIFIQSIHADAPFAPFFRWALDNGASLNPFLFRDDVAKKSAGEPSSDPPSQTGAWIKPRRLHIDKAMRRYDLNDPAHICPSGEQQDMRLIGLPAGAPGIPPAVLLYSFDGTVFYQLTYTNNF